VAALQTTYKVQLIMKKLWVLAVASAAFTAYLFAFVACVSLGGSRAWCQVAVMFQVGRAAVTYT